ncbi:MAG: hypothetical protein SFY56_06700 [Bacteroidota bacterium]|nr:hypothetical protein [Bacteroidota bacterium]
MSQILLSFFASILLAPFFNRFCASAEVNPLAASDCKAVNTTSGSIACGFIFNLMLAIIH